jgi:Mn2+/Fe2+ NRAMP family transporter
MFLNFIGLDPIKALIYSAVANGIIAPVMIFFIVKLSSREDVMGKYQNSRLLKVVGWTTFILMTAAAIGAIWSIV